MNLHGNHVSRFDLREAFDIFPAMEEINLSSNEVTEFLSIERGEGIDDELFAERLTKIDLSCNQITRLSNLNCLKNLKVLKLPYNRITSLSEFWGAGMSLQKLEFLDVRDNQLADARDLMYLQGLK